MTTIDDVLVFWFEEKPAANAAALIAKMKRWYRGGEAEDAAIWARFAKRVAQALEGGLDAWTATPRGGLALILLLDQMPRALFRGTARAFAGDGRAQAFAMEMLEDGKWSALGFEERHFVFMPLLHAEDAGVLDRFNELFPKALALVPDWARPILGDGIEQGRKYRDVIGRFGRFPHRNDALGRCSTPEELDFLRTWPERAAPRGAAALEG